MIRYAIRYLKQYSDHPLLASLIIGGVTFLAVGFALEAYRGADVWTGFFGLIATLWIAMGLLGYAIAFSAKGILLIQKRSGFA